jgi:hydrogenase maturation protein HypF
MGRLFDAASAMLGICKKRTYEGHPAMELEYAADFLECGEYEPCVKMDKGDIVIDGAEILAQTYNDFVNGASPEKAAARFHNTISRATVKAAQIAAYATGLSGVCLSGGCFQNALLLTRTIAMLTESGLTPYIHRRLPPNDECISYGQLIVAGAQRSNSIPQ